MSLGAGWERAVGVQAWGSGDKQGPAIQRQTRRALAAVKQNGNLTGERNLLGGTGTVVWRCGRAASQASSCAGVQSPGCGLMLYFPGLQTLNHFLTRGLTFVLHWSVLSCGWGLGKGGSGDISSQVTWPQTSIWGLKQNSNSPLQSPLLSILLSCLTFLQSSLHFLKLSVYFSLIYCPFLSPTRCRDLVHLGSLHCPQFLQQCLTHRNECCMSAYLQALGMLRFPGSQRYCWPPRGSSLTIYGRLGSLAQKMGGSDSGTKEDRASRARFVVRARFVFMLLSCILPQPSGNGETGQNTCVGGSITQWTWDRKRQKWVVGCWPPYSFDCAKVMSKLAGETIAF